MAVEVSAVFVKIGASGSITVRVEIDLYDPYPNTSGASSRDFAIIPFVVTIVH